VDQETIGGLIRISAQYHQHQTPQGKGKTKTIGVVQVTVHEAQDLRATQPYAKLYISNRGQDIKSTKHKTKTQCSSNPRFGEVFEFPIAEQSDLEEHHRLQISVWDHARLKANECTGGLSFSMLEIASTVKVDGWFTLLRSKEGRVQYEQSNLGHEDAHDDTLLPIATSPVIRTEETEWHVWVSPRDVPDDGNAILSPTGMSTTPEHQNQALVVLRDHVAKVTTEKADVDAALDERNNQLWSLMEKNAANVQRLADIMEENVKMRHSSLDTAGIRLRTGVIIKPDTGSLGFEIGNNVHARYTGVRISHVQENGPADGGAVRDGDVIIAINGDLVLGVDFDEIIKIFSDAGTVIVLSLASGKEVDAPGSPFWDDPESQMNPLDASSMEAVGNDNTPMVQ
jgi:hypothetical protein